MYGEKEQPPRPVSVGKAHELAQSFAAHAVSHLIMILGTDHELRRRDMPRGSAMPPLAIRRHLPRIHKALTPGAGERVETAKILIIAIVLPGEEHVQGMMKIIAPLRIQPIPAHRERVKDARIVEVTLGDDINPPVEALRLPVHGLSHLLEERLGQLVDDRMDGVETPGINVEIAPTRRGHSR